MIKYHYNCSCGQGYSRIMDLISHMEKFGHE